MPDERSNPDETISVTVFRPIAAALEEAGVEWRPLLGDCGIDPGLLRDAEARVPHARLARFWPNAARVLEDPLFGLHLAAHVRPHAVNLIGYLLMSSETVMEGLERVVRYQRLVYGTEFLRLSRDPGVVHVEVLPVDTADAGAQIGVEYLLGTARKYLEWVTERDAVPSHARLAHAPRGPLQEYRQVLGCTVDFHGGWSGMTFPRERLALPSVHANAEIARLHREYAEKQLVERRDRTMVCRVRKVIGAHLDDGEADLARVAERLNMSPRTVQRRLAAEDTSFKAVVSRMRRETALVLLEEGRAPLAEIAYVSGFSDPSNFSRAVRRWTGRSPSEYRRQRATG